MIVKKVLFRLILLILTVVVVVALGIPSRRYFQITKNLDRFIIRATEILNNTKNTTTPSKQINGSYS